MQHQASHDFLLSCCKFQHFQQIFLQWLMVFDICLAGCKQWIHNVCGRLVEMAQTCNIEVWTQTQMYHGVLTHTPQLHPPYPIPGSPCAADLDTAASWLHNQPGLLITAGSAGPTPPSLLHTCTHTNTVCSCACHAVTYKHSLTFPYSRVLLFCTHRWI